MRETCRIFRSMASERDIFLLRVNIEWQVFSIDMLTGSRFHRFGGGGDTFYLAQNKEKEEWEYRFKNPHQCKLQQYHIMQAHLHALSSDTEAVSTSDSLSVLSCPGKRRSCR